MKRHVVDPSEIYEGGSSAEKAIFAPVSVYLASDVDARCAELEKALRFCFFEMYPKGMSFDDALKDAVKELEDYNAIADEDEQI